MGMKPRTLHLKPKPEDLRGDSKPDLQCTDCKGTGWVGGAPSIGGAGRMAYMPHRQKCKCVWMGKLLKWLN